MSRCPNCDSKATKLYSISTGLYTCQVCDHEWPGESLIRSREDVRVLGMVVDVEEDAKLAAQDRRTR